MHRSYPFWINACVWGLLWLLSAQANASSPRGYEKLQQALLDYSKIASDGGWPSVPHGKLLKKGDQNERVALLKKRLMITGDLTNEEMGDPDVFDEALHNATVRFQRRHGLKMDGVAGPQTLQSANVPVAEKIRQIELNLPRMKQMPEDIEGYLDVNIAAFELDVFENGNTVLTMKVITGKQYWYTPEFSADMTYLVFNPSWYVPRSIAVREILPKVKKDPGYLLSEEFKVYLVTKGISREVDPLEVNWSEVAADSFNYRFVQQPGTKNPLGKVKFIFPNKYNVYLHDTPAKVLFEKSSRAFSHGCIRVEKPVELARHVLRGDPSWTHERILSAIETGKETTVVLPAPVHVHIHYHTAWVDENNIVHFRNDVYGRDR